MNRIWIVGSFVCVLAGSSLAKIDSFVSAGVAIEALTTGPDGNLGLLATETTVRGRDGRTTVFVSMATCSVAGAGGSMCISGSGSFPGGVLAKRGSRVSLNIPDARANAAFVFFRCDQTTCAPYTPPSPFPIQMTLETNGVRTDDFHGISQRSFRTPVGTTIRSFSNGHSSRDSASFQGYIGGVPVPSPLTISREGWISTSKGVSHTVEHDLKPEPRR